MRPTLVALALVLALASVMAVSASEAAVDVAGEVLVDAAAAVATSPIQVDAVLTDGMFVWWCVGGDVAASLRALVPRSLLRRTAYGCGGDVTAGASSCVWRRPNDKAPAAIAATVRFDRSRLADDVRVCVWTEDAAGAQLTSATVLAESPSQLSLVPTGPGSLILVAAEVNVSSSNYDSAARLPIQVVLVRAAVSCGASAERCLVPVTDVPV
jgi:hypothetical protein